MAEPALAARAPNARHALFAAAQVVLLLVAAWWVVLLSRTVSEQEELVASLEILRARAVASDLADREDHLGGRAPHVQHAALGREREQHAGFLPDADG